MSDDFDWGKESKSADDFDWNRDSHPSPKAPEADGFFHKGEKAGVKETFINKAAAAIPLGTQLVNAMSALGMQGAHALGHSGVHFTPEAAAELEQAGYSPNGPSLVNDYRKAQADFASRSEQGAKDNPWAAGIGTGVGTALSLAAPLPKVAIGGKGAGAGLRVLNNALTAAGYGALNSAANSKGDLTRGEVGQVASDALGIGGMRQAAADAGEGHYGRAALDVMGAGGIGGALTGGALGGAVEGVRASGALPAASAALKRFSNRRAVDALGASGQDIKAIGLARADSLGDFAHENGIFSPFASRQTMADRVEAARKATGDRLTNALAPTESAGSAITRGDAAAALEAEAAKLDAQPALKSVADKFRAQAEAIRNRPGAEAIPVTEFERDVARPYKKMTNWNDNLKLPQETMQKLPMALEARVESEAQKVGTLPEYLAAKKDYGALAGLSDITEHALERDSVKKHVGLYDAMAALAAMQHGHSPGTMLTNAALGYLGSKAMGRFGNQFAGSGARGLSRMLASNPTPQNPAQTAAVFDALFGAPQLRPSPQLSDADREKMQQYAQAMGGAR